MTKDEALKLALEALEATGIQWPLFKEAITAIREALAQPEQDEKFCDSNCVWTDHHPDCKLAQPEQGPVAWRYALDASIEGPRWIYIDKDPHQWLNGPAMAGAVIEPLYTTPPHRKPLSDEEIDKLPWEPHEGNPMTFAEGLRYFARAIEAAHGIWPENSDCYGSDWTDRDGEYLK